MSDDFKQSLDLYTNLVTTVHGKPPLFNHAVTLFLDDAASIASPQRDPYRKLKAGESNHTCPWCMDLFVPDKSTKGGRSRNIHIMRPSHEDQMP